MNPWRAPIALLRNLLARPDRATAGAEASAPEHAEYEDLLRAIGGGPDEAAGPAASDLRDATIAELRRVFEELRPLGEQLAESERARLAAEEEARRLAAAMESIGADVEGLRGELAKQTALRARLEERAAALRAKRDERHRVAADRWREIRRLRGECKRLERELEAQRRSWDELEAPLRRIAEQAGELDAEELRSLAEPLLAAPSFRRDDG